MGDMHYPMGSGLLGLGHALGGYGGGQKADYKPEAVVHINGILDPMIAIDDQVRRHNPRPDGAKYYYELLPAQRILEKALPAHMPLPFEIAFTTREGIARYFGMSSNTFQGPYIPYSAFQRHHLPCATYLNTLRADRFPHYIQQALATIINPDERFAVAAAMRDALNLQPFDYGFWCDIEVTGVIGARVEEREHGECMFTVHHGGSVSMLNNGPEDIEAEQYVIADRPTLEQVQRVSYHGSRTPRQKNRAVLITRPYNPDYYVAKFAEVIAAAKAGGAEGMSRLYRSLLCLFVLVLSDGPTLPADLMRFIPAVFEYDEPAILVPEVVADPMVVVVEPGVVADPVVVDVVGGEPVPVVVDPSLRRPRRPAVAVAEPVVVDPASGVQVAPVPTVVVQDRPAAVVVDPAAVGPSLPPAAPSVIVGGGSPSVAAPQAAQVITDPVQLYADLAMRTKDITDLYIPRTSEYRKMIENKEADATYFVKQGSSGIYKASVEEFIDRTANEVAVDLVTVFDAMSNVNQAPDPAVPLAVSTHAEFRDAVESFLVVAGEFHTAIRNVMVIVKIDGLVDDAGNPVAPTMVGQEFALTRSATALGIALNNLRAARDTRINQGFLQARASSASRKTRRVGATEHLSARTSKGRASAARNSDAMDVDEPSSTAPTHGVSFSEDTDSGERAQKRPRRLFPARSEVVREPTHESARQPAREPSREPAREPAREPTREIADQPAEISANVGVRGRDVNFSRDAELNLPVVDEQALGFLFRMSELARSMLRPNKLRILVNILIERRIFAKSLTSAQPGGQLRLKLTRYPGMYC